MKTILFLSVLFLLALAGLERGQAQTPVPLGMEDVIWQKEGLSVTSLAFSPTQPYIAVGTTSWPVLLDLNTGIEKKKFICKNSITGLRFTNDGNYLYTGNSDGQLIKWNTVTWDSVIIDDYTLSTKCIFMIDYNHLKNLVATASADSGLKVYGALTNQRLIEWKEMPIIDSKLQRKAAVTSVSFRYDGKIIAIGMKDADATWLYDIETRQIIKKINGEDGQYSPTNNELIVKKIKHYESSELLDGLDYYKFDESEIPVNLDIGELWIDTKYVFNSLGNKIIVAGGSFKIKVYEIDEFRLLNIIEEPFLGGFLSVSKDDKYLLTLGGTGQLYLVNIEKYTDIREPELIQSFNIFPNPTNNFLTIEYSLLLNSNINITLTDLQGVFLGEIFSGFQNTGVNTINYPINNLPSGIYFVNININGSISNKQFEIIR